MLEPLKQFICDDCGQIIAKPEDGYVEWITENTKDGRCLRYGFRIVHAAWTSPRKCIKEGCYKYGNEYGRSDMGLEWFIKDGISEMFSMLSPKLPWKYVEHEKCGIVDFYEFREFYSRLIIPYYEEARLYFGKALDDDFIDDGMSLGELYSGDTLKMIVDKYTEY